MRVLIVALLCALSYAQTATCDDCLSEFNNIGGCMCWHTEGCDVPSLLPQGCMRCEAESAAHCGIGSCNTPLTANNLEGEHVDLEKYGFCGPLPEIWNGMTALTYLALNSNALTGTLPESWQSMTALTYLSLSVNDLTGTLPDSWQSMTALTYLSLYDNDLTGTLPDSWQSMTALTVLDLENNDLTGTLPDSWQSMTALMYLYLDDNDLTGTLPDSWQSMSNLNSFWIDNNYMDILEPEICNSVSDCRWSPQLTLETTAPETTTTTTTTSTTSAATTATAERQLGETCGYVFPMGDVGTCAEGLECACVGMCADPNIADYPSTCVEHSTSPVDCVADNDLTRARCTSACGTVSIIGNPEAANGGALCDPNTYDCQHGDGDCTIEEEEEETDETFCETGDNVKIKCQNCRLMNSNIEKSDVESLGHCKAMAQISGVKCFSYLEIDQTGGECRIAVDPNACADENLQFKNHFDTYEITNGCCEDPDVVDDSKVDVLENKTCGGKLTRKNVKNLNKCAKQAQKKGKSMFSFSDDGVDEDDNNCILPKKGESQCMIGEAVDAVGFTVYRYEDKKIVCGLCIDYTMMHASSFGYHMCAGSTSNSNVESFHECASFADSLRATYFSYRADKGKCQVATGSEDEQEENCIASVESTNNEWSVWKVNYCSDE